MALEPPHGGFPFQFNLKVGWATTIGHKIRDDCDAAMAELPRSTREKAIVFRSPRIVSVGDCAIGIYVTNPDPSGTTVITESWDALVKWIMGANNLNTGSCRSGWMVTGRSGVQVCFWEPKVVDPYHMCESPRPFEINHAMTLATCLDILYIPAAATPSIAATTIPPAAVHSTAIVEAASHVPASLSPGEDIILGIGRRVRAWAGDTFSLSSCIPVVHSLKKAAISNVVNPMLFLKYPQIYGDKLCSCGIFLTHPPASGQGMEIMSKGVNFRDEAYRLMVATVLRDGSGGFVDLPSGFQIVLYNADLVDPKRICSLTSRITLRKCLDNMVAYDKLERK
ncbi:hypothetical protein MMC11_005508 [Xylographa trunciseda]|nr:hypothetical protein [Xylographa trunciseda]